jgi:hypothetical protein
MFTKRFFLTAIVALALTPFVSGQTKTDLPDLELQGSVSSATITTYEAVVKFGELAKGDIRSQTTYAFNKAGYKILRIDRKSASVQDTTTYEYNDKNLLIKEIKPDGEERTITYTLGATGKPTQSEEVFTFPDSTNDYKKINSHNGQGLITESDKKDRQGELLEKTKIKYNVHGDRTEALVYNGSGKLTSSSKHLYNLNNKPSSITIESNYKGAAMVMETKMQYDKQQNITEQTVDIAITPPSGAYNLGITHIRTTATMTYTLDAKRNWIKQEQITVSSTGGTKKSIIERDIVYY